MEIIINFIYKVKFLVILMAFFIHGYSNPSDTIKKQNCLNGFSLEINGKSKWIDTTLRYYPANMDNIIQGYCKFTSLNLQLLEEPKWNNENTQEGRLRIFLIEYAPNFDSIVLYSFINHDKNYIKFIKKEMPVFYYPGYFLPTSTYSFNNIEEATIVNYKQTEFLIHKRKMPKVIRQVKKYPKGDTFDGYGWSPIIVIEYIFKGSYHQIISPAPELLYKLPTRIFAK